MDLLLDARDIHASYDQRKILKGVDISLGRGEILGLIGTNGAGKTTLMSVLSGSVRPESGQMVIAGERYAPDSLEEAQAGGVGLIAQNFRLDPELSVAQAIFRGTFQAGKPTSELREQALELIHHVGVDLDPEAKVGTLIRAEQTLTEVIRMLAEETQLVIMDEVASSLPDHDVAILHRVIRMLASPGRSIIYITHRLDEIRSISHRIAVMRDGQVYKVLNSTQTDVEELAFLLLQEKLEKTERPAAPSPEDQALRVINLSVGNTVRNVSFEIARGEIFGLVGTHRSGVYQVIESLVGVQPSTSGQIFVNGQQVQIASVQDAERLKIGYLSDAAGDDEADDSIVGSLQHGETDAELRDEVAHLRGVIDLVRRMRISTTNIHGTIATLSGGDRQKVELAKWMTTSCDVLILSHPSRGIDIGAKEIVYKMLAELSQTGVAIILLSSDMSELVDWCHRVGVIRDGELVAVERTTETNEDRLVTHMLAEGYGPLDGSARRAKQVV